MKNQDNRTHAQNKQTNQKLRAQNKVKFIKSDSEMNQMFKKKDKNF